jgi:hypothetical protein
MVTPMGDFHHPDRLCFDYPEKKKQIIEAIKDGMTPKDATMMVVGITRGTWQNWVKYAEDDMSKGFTEEDSRLIDLMLSMASEELTLRRRLEKRANRLALYEDNTDMLKFLLERRHGYKKETKKDVDIEVKDEVPVKFEFVDMTPTENED